MQRPRLPESGIPPRAQALLRVLDNNPQRDTSGHRPGCPANKGLNASELGKHFNVSPQRMNLTLAELGWIERAVKGWIPTQQGIDLGAGAASFNGRPYVRWPSATAQNKILANALQEGSSTPAAIPAAPASGTDPQDDPRQAFAAQYRTADGHYVRSRAELAIDNWLYMQGLVHAYERRVPITETVISDFFLPAQHVYIEYWGSNEPEYLKRKRKKQELYRKHGLKLVNVEDRHRDNLDDALPKLLIPPHGVD